MINLTKRENFHQKNGQNWEIWWISLTLFSILVALELLIWHSVLLFQHQTQQYKQNLTNLNYVHWYFSITYVSPHLKNNFF